MLKLTPQGAVLLSYALAGTARLEFTHVRIGSGTDAGPNPTALTHPVLTVPFQTIVPADARATMTAVFNNSTLQTGFRMTEIGVYAFDPEDPYVPCLYAYEYVPASRADFIPANEDRILETKLILMVFIGEAANVTIRLSQDLYAAFPKDTASGSPANFPDGADGVPVADLTAEIALTQPGSGLPSQENVRPISTFTGLTLSHSGADTSDPETIAISWQTEAGTVIAGTLDVTTGVLSITHVDYSAEAWANSTADASGSTYVQGKFTPQNQGLTVGRVISDRFSTEYPSGTANKMAFIINTGTKRLFFNVPISELSDTTTEALRAWLTAKKPQFVFEYETPVTVQLAPQDVLTLLGENNLWADTGAVTVDYRADTGLYIDKRLAPSLGTQSLSAAPGLLRTGMGLEPQSPVLDEGETASAEAEAEGE